jgi:hypothetical protein
VNSTAIIGLCNQGRILAPSLSFIVISIHYSVHLSFIDLERGGFGEILHEVMIFPEGLCPEGNIITEGNISPNPPSGGSINDILYRKLKASKLRIKNLTHTFVNTMFYFRIKASIVAFLSNHISFGILMTKPQVLAVKKSQVLGLKLNYSSLINTIYVLSAILLSCVLSRVVYANNVPPHVPPGRNCQKERRLAN